MDFLAGERIEKLTAAVKDLCASVGAIGQLLVDKGVATEKEVVDMKVRVMAQLDQMGAELEEKKLAKMTPVQRSIYESVGLDLSKPEE
jgi:hypothetical protein